MAEAIGIRMDDEFLRKIDRLTKEESEDRSTLIRKLSLIGYREFMKDKAAREYIEGKITISEAAHRASLTIFDLEKVLVEKGFVSRFALEDLELELRLLP